MNGCRAYSLQTKRKSMWSTTTTSDRWAGLLSTVHHWAKERIARGHWDWRYGNRNMCVHCATFTSRHVRWDIAGGRTFTATAYGLHRTCKTKGSRYTYDIIRLPWAVTSWPTQRLLLDPLESVPQLVIIPLTDGFWWCWCSRTDTLHYIYQPLFTHNLGEEEKERFNTQCTWINRYHLVVCVYRCAMEM